MGVDTTAYLGVFIKVAKETKTVKKIFYTTESGKKRDTAFNPATGEPYIKNVEYVEEDLDVCPYEIFDAFDDFELEGLSEDAIWLPQYCGDKDHEFFIPNGRNDGSWTVDKDDEDVYYLENIDPQALILKFRRKYAPYISLYKRLFKNVSIEFGFFSYSH